MLAGKVKLKTFGAVVAVLLVTGTLVAVVGTALLGTAVVASVEEERASQVAEQKRSSPEPIARAKPINTPATSAPVEPAASEPSADAIPVDASRPWDAVLLGKAGQSLGSKKVKDAVKGKSWKVNLYQDEGNASVNRAKVDIDRDDKWDEKWTFADDGITRKVSPADDEDYTASFVWTGSAWESR